VVIGAAIDGAAMVTTLDSRMLPRAADSQPTPPATRC
jgi:hypothetical protein